MPVRIETQALSEPRFRIMGALAKVSHWDAIGRCAQVWDYCTEKAIYDISYSTLVALVGGPEFADAMIMAELATVVGVNHLGEDLLYIRGTKGRIEWLGEKREIAARARAMKKAKRSGHNSIDSKSFDSSIVRASNDSSIDSGYQKVYQPEQEQEQECVINTTLNSSCSAIPESSFSSHPASEEILGSNTLRARGIGNDKVKAKAKAIVYDKGFVEAWELYPRKTAKAEAAKAWDKLDDADRTECANVLAFTLAPAWTRATKADLTYLPHLATYLNQRRWEDEHQPTPKSQDAGGKGLSAADIWAMAEEMP